MTIEFRLEQFEYPALTDWKNIFGHKPAEAAGALRFDANPRKRLFFQEYAKLPISHIIKIHRNHQTDGRR